VRLPALPSLTARAGTHPGDPFSDFEAGRWLSQCALLGDGLFEVHVGRGIWQTVTASGA
jgi:hypothetical protein